MNGITTHYDNEPYLSRLFDDRLGQTGGFNGTYTYTFLVVNRGNGILSPYQEAASGTNNEKYNGDFGQGVNIITFLDVLPVTGLQLTAKLNNSITALDWKTETESNSAYFIVERSIDGRNFIQISNHIIAAGNSATTKHYQFNDDISNTFQNNKIYYRVKEIDIDGKTTVSNIVLVTLKSSATISTWPNPFTSSVTVSINSSSSTTLMMRITNVSGLTIKTYKQAVQKGVTQITINEFDKLAAGVYLLEIVDTINGSRTTEKLIKANN